MLLVYLSLAFFLPQLYRHYKIQQTQKQATELVARLRGVSRKQAQELIADFKKANSDLTVTLVDEQGEVILFPSVVHAAGSNLDTAVSVYPAMVVTPANQQDAATGQDGQVAVTEETTAAAAVAVGEPLTKQNGTALYTITKTVPLADGRYQLILYTPLQPVDEIPKVFLMLLPLLVVGVLASAFIAARLLSRLITRPLLEINDRAQRFQQLDLSRQTVPVYRDELQELSVNLDKMAENLQQTMDQLQSANARLAQNVLEERQLKQQQIQLLIAVGHDLKTPFAVVQGILEGVRLKIPPYDQPEKYLLKAEERLRDLGKLIEQVNQIAKIEYGSQTAERVLLQPVLETIRGRNELRIKEKQLVLTWQLPEEPLAIWLDRFSLERLTGNLLENAVYYTEPGGQLAVTAVVEADYCRLEIRNQTEALSQGELAWLFEPLTRKESSRSRNSGGSGLGLFLVKRILEANHLDYQVGYREGFLIFEIRLPLAVADPAVKNEN